MKDDPDQGKNKGTGTVVKSYLYQSDSILRKDLAVEEYSRALKDDKNLLWVDIEKPDDDDVDILLNVFGLHPLTVEDCLVPNARPKVEQFPNYLFVALQAVTLNQPEEEDEEEEVEAVEVDICIGKNFVLTVHADPIKGIKLNQDRIEKNSHIITKGPDFLFHSITDAIVDYYFPIIDKLEDKIEDIEDDLFSEADDEALNKLYTLKKNMMFLRRSVGPLRDVINILLRGDFDQISAGTHIYFRDIYDHLVRINDLIGTNREIITGALDAYAKISTNKLNEIMKILTIICTIMMPLTLITGIYGMNFKFMPEIGWKYGYLFVWGLMVIIIIGMLMFFKRRKWLS